MFPFNSLRLPGSQTPWESCKLYFFPDGQGNYIYQKHKIIFIHLLTTHKHKILFYLSNFIYQMLSIFASKFSHIVQKILDNQGNRLSDSSENPALNSLQLKILE